MARPAHPTRFAARNWTDLRAQLQALDIVIDRDHKKQRDLKAAEELFTLRKGLAKRPDPFDGGPVRLEKSESPDFILTSGPRRIRIEITELVSPNARHADAIAKETAQSTLHVGPLQMEPDIVDENHLQAEMEGACPGFHPGQAERMARALLKRAIKKKSQKLTEPTLGNWADMDENRLFLHNKLGVAGLHLAADLDTLRETYCCFGCIHLV